MGTLLNWTRKNFRVLTCSLEAFLARLSVWRESDRALTSNEERSFSNLLGLPKVDDPRIYSLKTLKVSYLRKEGIASQAFFRGWMNWGIASNGRCLTASISGFRRTGSVSLSTVLEKEVDKKYFLSEKALAYLNKRAKQNKHLRGYAAKVYRQP